MILFILIFIVMSYMVFRPYLDVSKDRNGKYHIILWYTDIFYDERKFIKILGSQN